MLALDLTSVGPLTPEAFFQLCRQHPDLKLERSANGELIIMPPTGGETGQCFARVCAESRSDFMMSAMLA
jgi:Uma2 family endonuclease